LKLSSKLKIGQTRVLPGLEVQSPSQARARKCWARSSTENIFVHYKLLNFVGPTWPRSRSLLLKKYRLLTFGFVKRFDNLHWCKNQHAKAFYTALKVFYCLWFIVYTWNYLNTKIKCSTYLSSKVRMKILRGKYWIRFKKFSIVKRFERTSWGCIWGGSGCLQCRRSWRRPASSDTSRSGTCCRPLASPTPGNFQPCPGKTNETFISNVSYELTRSIKWYCYWQSSSSAWFCNNCLC